MFQPLGVFIDQFLRGFRSTREVLALKSGLELLRKGKVAEAIKEFDVAIKKDPRNGTAYTLRAVANGAIGKYPASLADANRALELNPNSATASAARGKAMFQLQMDRVAALAELDKAIALDSASAYQFVNRGDVRRQLMDWEGAIADFSKAVALAADSVTIFYERGRAYRMQRKLVKAAEDFNQVIELNPSEPQLALAFAGLGDVLRLAGDQKLGEANIQRGLEINREFVAIYFYQLGALFGRLEQFPTALNYYNEAERYGFQSVWLYFNRGTIRLKQDEYGLALTDLTEAIRLNPQNNKSRAHRALTFLANNDYANAISDSNQVLQAETDSETLGLAYYIRGMSRMQLDDDSLLSHAISDFSAAIQHGNSSANVYYSRGYCKLNARDAVGALEDCNNAIELNPQDACAYYYRAKVYCYMQNFAQSIADSTTAIELDAQQSDFYLFRGIAYFRSGERQLAKANFDKALELDSNSYIAYAERSNLQRIGGDLAAVQADIAACLKACPDAFAKYAKAAFLYHDLGDIEGAILSSERALQIQSDHPDAAMVQQRITDWRDPQ